MPGNYKRISNPRRQCCKCRKSALEKDMMPKQKGFVHTGGCPI